jgi:hypothetical protein
MTRIFYLSLFSVLLFTILTTQNALAQSNIDQTDTNPTTIPITFHLPNTDIPAQINADSIQVFFNPTEIKVDKFVPWQKHKNAGGNAPTIEFTSGEPYRLQAELLFDTFETGTDVREYTDKLSKLAVIDSEKHKPPKCVLMWANSMKFKCVLESFTVRFTLFLDDGTPVRAVADTTFKELVPAEKQLNKYTVPREQLLDLLDASQYSIPLLASYEEESLRSVVRDFFGDLDVETTTSTLLPFPQIDDLDSIQPTHVIIPDGMITVDGFRIEITGPADGENEDNEWETETGGALNIEVAPASVGKSQFQTTTPGHKFVEEIQLKGPMTKHRKAISDWINGKPVVCKKCKDVTLSFLDQNDKPVNQFTFKALDVFFFKNEILLVMIQDDRLQLTLLDIQRTRADGSPYFGPPRIFVVLPTSMSGFLPVVIAGSNFDSGAVPFFNGVPSITLFNWSTQNIPLIGSIGIGVTIVPPSAPLGAGNVQVEYFGQKSNPFPFTIN